VNAGSSSLKLSVLDEQDRVVVSESVPSRGGRVDEAAVTAVARRGGDVDAVGHRVVHGGTEFVEPVLVDADVLRRLQALSDLARQSSPAARRARCAPSPATSARGPRSRPSPATAPSTRRWASRRSKGS